MSEILFLATPNASLTASFVGILTERLVIRRFDGRINDTMLATWGLLSCSNKPLGWSFGCHSLR